MTSSEKAGGSESISPGVQRIKGADMFQSNDEDFRLWILLNQARDVASDARKKELARYGISPREAAILWGISTIGKDVTPTKLAHWVYRKPHTISAILNRMQNKGLVKLSKDTEIRNLVRITLTEEGEKALKASLKEASIHRIFKTFSDEMIIQLETYLNHIMEIAIKQTGENMPKPIIPSTFPERDRISGLWVLLDYTIDATFNARKKELARYGISPKESAILSGVYTMGKDTTPAKLARLLFREPPSIAGILDRMQKKGLVELSKDTETKNLVRITLTAEGKKALKATLKGVTIHRIFKTFNEEMAAELEQYLSQIMEKALKQTGAVPVLPNLLRRQESPSG